MVQTTFFLPVIDIKCDASYTFPCSLAFIHTYNATSPFNPHGKMDKTFLPSYSSSQITYVEAVEFLRFCFHILVWA